MLRTHSPSSEGQGQDNCSERSHSKRELRGKHMVTLTPKNSGIRPGICRRVALLRQRGPVLLPGSGFLTHCSPLPPAPLSSSWLRLLRQQSFSIRISLCWPLSSFLSLIPTQTKSWMPKEGLYCSLWNLRPFYSKLAMVFFVFYHDFILLKQFLAHSKIKGVEQRFPIYSHPHTCIVLV